jgi:hypothetical protein
MHRHLRSCLPILLAALLLSACSKVPDNARYIPKDAVAVAGINLKALGKKIAWNVITGSKLFKEMQKRMPAQNAKDAITGIERAGLDVSNTFYVYVKTDTRFAGGNRVTGLIPLSDAGQWESYIKQVFPQVAITQHGDRKEASLGSDMYVAWTKNILLLTNVMTSGIGDGAPNTAAISAELDNTFNLAKDNSMISNVRFATLESEGHDLTFWLNYGLLLNQYSGEMADKMGGVTLSNTLWKDAAFTSGFDFVKGKITGDMRYYLPEEMNEVGKEFGAVNVDKDMLDHLPGKNMDMLLALHLAPKGVKAMLEKTGLLGLANVGLSTQGMTADNVLDAVTGDMAIVMNDFSLTTETVVDSFMGQLVPHKNQKPAINMTYVIKINNKDNFKKLMDLAGQNGLIHIPNGYVMPISDKDSVFMITNDHYAVVSNKQSYASGFLDGTLKDNKMPETAASQVYGHPFAVYFDIQQFFNNIDPSIGGSPQDSAMITESKKLINNIAINGGQFKNSAYEFHLDVNFNNTDENSIIQLIDFGMRMNDAQKVAAQ